VCWGGCPPPFTPRRPPPPRYTVRQVAGSQVNGGCPRGTCPACPATHARRLPTDRPGCTGSLSVCRHKVWAPGPGVCLPRGTGRDSRGAHRLGSVCLEGLNRQAAGVGLNFAGDLISLEVYPRDLISLEVYPSANLRPHGPRPCRRSLRSILPKRGHALWRSICQPPSGT
jgi:hypothetical protein